MAKGVYIPFPCNRSKFCSTCVLAFISSQAAASRLTQCIIQYKCMVNQRKVSKTFKAYFFRAVVQDVRM